MASREKPVPISSKFLIASTSGMTAALFVHPLDIIKNYMQLSGMGSAQRVTTFSTITEIFHASGIKGFYKGLTAGIFRQAVYGGCRVGSYMYMLQLYDEKYHSTPNFYSRIAFASTAGFLGSIVGTPSEVVLIRMTADGKLPPEQRRNYTHVFNALKRIAQEEGVKGLWTGFTTTMSRAIVANAAELASYSQTKEYLLSTPYFVDNVGTHIVCSVIATFANLSVSLPFDVAKTRIQTQQVSSAPTSKNPLPIMYGVIRNEGVTALWKGYTPSFICFAPRNIIIFVVVEYLTKMYKVYVMGYKDTSSEL